MKVVPVKVGQVRIVADHLPTWKTMAVAAETEV